MDISSITILQAAVIFAAGVVAGFVNSLAGGGSLIAIASLLFLGLPSPIANATNRVAIVLQNSVSVRAFRRAGLLDFRHTLQAIVPAGLGAVAGTLIAVEVSERIFDIALAVVLVLVVITVFIPAPKAGSRRLHSRSKGASAILRGLAFFLTGLYGGFVQSGVGFLLIAVVSLIHESDLVATNAIKVSVVMAFGAISLAIFAFHGMVVWSAGLLLGAGTMAGAWIGVHAALRHGAGFVRWVIVASAGAAALRLLGVL